MSICARGAVVVRMLPTAVPCAITSAWSTAVSSSAKIDFARLRERHHFRDAADVGNVSHRGVQAARIVVRDADDLEEPPPEMRVRQILDQRGSSRGGTFGRK